MAKQPLVSIITPTYNHERFIGQCIQSILTQTYPNWEQIIIDDGSTDRTGKIVAEYRDERIRYFKQRNIGIWKLSETYNKALWLSYGELIAVLEGDDFWPPDKLEKQVPVFGKEEIVLSWGKVARTDSSGSKITQIYPCKNLKRFRNRSKEEMLKGLLLRDFIPACTVICRKDALLSIKGFKHSRDAPFVDYLTWLELSLLGELYPIDEVLGYWRQHGKQASNWAGIAMAEAGGRCSLAFFQQLPQELKDSIGISADNLVTKCQHNVASAYFRLGRTLLYNKRWREARPNFIQALNKGDFYTKLKALLGIGCSYTKADLEPVAFIMRKPLLRELKD